MKISTEGPPNAKIFFVGDFPSEEDSRTGKPFSGREGVTLNNLLAQANIARYQCLTTTVARDRPPANRIGYFFEDKKCTIPKLKMLEWINLLKQEIELYQPNVVVALGPTALWALTQEKKISDFRGYVIPCTLCPGVKVIPAYHPKAINFDWKLYFQTVLDFRKIERHSKSPKLLSKPQTFLPNVSAGKFIAYMEECIAHPEWKYLAIDVETVQPGSHIEELGLSHHRDFGISVFFLKGRDPALPESDELKIWQTFVKLISMKKLIMQNGTYDTGILWYNQHILCPPLWMDTLIAAHICWPELPRDLGFLGSVCLDVPPWKSGSAKNQDYNPADAANTLGIAEVLNTEIDKQGSRETFEFEMSLIYPSLMMQLQGIKVNRKIQKALIKGWSKRRGLIHQQLNTIIGRPINFNSPKQMQELLYGELKLPIQYKRRKSVKQKRTMTTDAAALRTLARLVPDNPIFNLLLDYKKADKLISSFLEIELSPDSKVHTSYNITGAASDDEEDTKKTKRSFGRWSSSKSIILPYGSGNLQNIPPIARRMYKAKPGWVIIEADYKQAEAVVVAQLTGDYKLQKLFKDSFGLAPSECGPYDIHKITIADMMYISTEEVTKKLRDIGKVARHSNNYAAGPTVMANRLGIKMGEAKQLSELFHKANPGIRQWHTATQEELKKTRVLTNLLGRKHHFLDRWGDTLFRSAYSYIPQSTIGDLLNKALRRVYDGIKDLPYEMAILLQLHDAIYPTVKEENVDHALRFLRERMLIPLTYNNKEFTIDVDFHIKTSWAKGESVDINWREYDKRNSTNTE